MSAWLALHPVTGRPPAGRVRTMKCCCCGAVCEGRQWWNRDTGYGICPKCATAEATNSTPEDMHMRYGREGVHYLQMPDNQPVNTEQPK